MGENNAGAAPVQQSGHCHVVGRDQRGEVVDACQAAAVSQSAQ